MTTTAPRLFFTLLVLASLRAHAQEIEIPCEGSPPEAVMSVPAPADRFVHVVCTKYGHVLAPVAGWFWSPPGTYSPTFFPAQMVRSNPKEVGNSVYFKFIQVTPLEGEEAAEHWQVIGRMFHDVPPTRALKIVATNSSDSEHTIYIFPNSWGYSCSPSCKQDAAFIMISQDKHPPSW